MMKRKKSKQLWKQGLVIFLLIVTFCFAMFQGGFVSWFIFFATLPFLIYTILLQFVPVRITNIKRTINPDFVTRGSKVNVHVTFQNKTLFPLLFLTVREKMNNADLEVHMEGKSQNLFLVLFKKDFEWEYELRNIPRGEFHFEGFEVVMTDFFGWTEREFFVPKHDLMLVYPKITDVQNAQINLHYDQGNTNVTRSLVKDTTIATGIRKYESGDRFSWIHWKSFAKSGELKTKEFEDIQAQNVVVYLDRSSQPNFEGVVDLCASLLKVGVRARADVSFFTAGEERKLFPLIRSESQLERVMQYLAVTQMDPFTSFVEHAIRSEQQLVSRSIVFILTSRIDENLELLLMSGSKLARAIICFVVVSEDSYPLVDRSKRYPGQNKIVYLTEAMFSQALVEVGNR
jgi:uncharacterized protein (DUF58 family)